MNLVAITGPTCSGKSEMAIQVSKVLGNSIIVNCDSRQVYRGLNIGTAKVEGEWRYQDGLKAFYYEDIPHFLIDYVNPQEDYSLARFLVDWCLLFKNEEVSKFENVILVGGTGLYLKAILEEMQVLTLEGESKKNFEKRKNDLNDLNLVELKSILFKFNSKYETSLNNSDLNNPRRLVNYILKEEFKEFKNDPGSSKILENEKKVLDFPNFKNKKTFYINVPKNELDLRIEKRVLERFEKGLLEETKFFLSKLGIQKMQSLGLEYRLCSLFLLGQLNYDEMKKALIRENIKYAKRQVTWFKKQNYVQVENYEEVFNQI
jgi:tRNA dimethylallyltransferase